MEQFSLEKYIENPSRKVVTRDGREVVIYYSPTSRIPLIGRTSDNEIHQYTEDGFQYEMMNQAKNDLFFADEEEELTEFEKVVQNLMDKSKQGVFDPKSEDDVREVSKNILNIARKELQPEFDKELDEAYKTRDEVVYLEGYDKGHEDALKDLPKWKKSTKILSENPYLAFYPSDGHRELCVNGFEINIYELFETLPKEE